MEVIRSRENICLVIRKKETTPSLSWILYRYKDIVLWLELKSSLLSSFLTERLTYWMTEWLTDRLIVWITNWRDGRNSWKANWLACSLSDSLVHWWMKWLTDELTVWLIYWLTDWLSDWFTDWPFAYLINYSSWTISIHLSALYMYYEAFIRVFFNQFFLTSFLLQCVPKKCCFFPPCWGA